MKDVSEQAAPLLLRLGLHGVWALDEAEKLALSAWAAMFTMTFEFADTKTQMSTEEDRRYLMNHHAPPGHWGVMIGSYAGSRWIEQVNHKGFSLGAIWSPLEAPTMSKGYITVFTFGQLALLTYSLRNGMHPLLEDFLASLRLQRIFPSDHRPLVKPASPKGDLEMEWAAHGLETILFPVDGDFGQFILGKKEAAPRSPPSSRRK